MLFTDKEKIRDRIVRILGIDPLLTFADLQSRLRADRVVVTDQAVFRELRILLAEEVVLKNKGRYLLGFDWSLKLLNFAEQISDSIGNESLTEVLLQGRQKKRTWSFTKLRVMKRFWSHLVVHVLKRERAGVILSWNPTPWFYLTDPSHQQAMMSTLRRNGCHMYKIIGEHVWLEKLGKAVWDPSVATYSSNQSIYHGDDQTYFSVIGDYVIELSVGKKLAMLLRELALASSIESAHQIVFNLMESRVVTKLTFHHSPRRAQRAYRYFREYFGELRGIEDS